MLKKDANNAMDISSFCFHSLYKGAKLSFYSLASVRTCEKVDSKDLECNSKIKHVNVVLWFGEGCHQVGATDTFK